VKYRNMYWAVKCDCGTESIAAGTALRNGTTTNCGCFKRSLPGFTVYPPNTIDHFYLIRMKSSEESFLKFGRTTYTVEKRFAAKEYKPFTITPIFIVRDVHQRVQELESMIKVLRMEGRFKAFRPSRKFVGYTEAVDESSFLALCEYIDDFFNGEVEDIV
jgi:hypothetical protein